MLKSVVVVCVLGGVAHAEGDLAVTMGSDIRALHTESANALTGDSLVGGQVGAMYRLPVAPAPRLSLWAEAGFVGSAAQGTMFGTLTTEVTLRELVAGVQARYGVFRHVVAYAKADLGAARDAVAIASTMPGGGRERDARWGAVASGALGLELLAIDGGADASRWDIGLRVELGYAKQSKIALAPSPDRPDDDTLRLPMTEAGLGHLDLSGPTFSGGIVGHF